MRKVEPNGRSLRQRTGRSRSRPSRARGCRSAGCGRRGVPGSKSPAPVERERRLGRRPEVGRAAEEPGDVLRQRVQHLARRVAARDALRVGGKRRQARGPSRRAARAAASASISAASAGMLARGSAAKSSSHAAVRRAPRAPMPCGEVLAHAVGHEELRVLGPAVGALGQPDLLVAERLAVRGGGVLLVRRAVADVAVDDDQRRPAFGLAGRPSSACSMRSRSLASPTRGTFQP